MKNAIKHVLTEHKVIDTGISDEIAEIAIAIISNEIGMQLNLGSVAGLALQGILAHPETGRSDYQAVSEMAINQAENFMKELDRRRDYAAQTIH